jgi:two-component system phosphate regulon sensor histidine kinase PhoR
MRLENEIALTDDSLTLKQAKEQLESNIEELDKLTNLAEGLLELARLDNESLQKDNVKVQDMIQAAMSRVASEAELKKQIVVAKKLDKGTVSVNETAIVEALVTILDNAVKYSPKKTEIVITTKRSKSFVDISVKDTGPGISPIDQKKIFDRFYRVDDSRTKESIEGYGIGLSIAKTVMESHGGSISVNSNIGKGSTFTIHIPVK